jgi:hypothetical protein
MSSRVRRIRAIVRDLMHVGAGAFWAYWPACCCSSCACGPCSRWGDAVSLLWTFGLTRLTIGYLNSSTGFLVSIIAGNGINYGIMYRARYIEARRDEATACDFDRLAHRDSWLPTLADRRPRCSHTFAPAHRFRGFKHFGVISAYGGSLLGGDVRATAILVASSVCCRRSGRAGRGQAVQAPYGVVLRASRAWHQEPSCSREHWPGS